MYNGMMDPEMIRLAQEQMSRIPPEELARIQQQMLSNPDLMRMATESMKNLRPEDMRQAAEHLKHARPEDMVEISEKVAKASPEEIAAMKSRADAQISYELTAAQMLKKQGNELHSRGQYLDASQKYLHAKNNLKGIPSAKCGTLKLQCSLNLMSCYLKTRQFEDCIKEGSEVLEYDSQNVKALYRRGQAYKELGKLEAAVIDLKKAHEVSPEDETISDVLRDTNEKLQKDHGDENVPRGVVIKEIEEEEIHTVPSDHSSKSTSTNYTVTHPGEAGGSPQPVKGSYSGSSSAPAESLERLKDDPESIRLFQNYVSSADPSSLAAMGGVGMPPGMVKTATDMISKMKPEELQSMFKLASSMNGKGPMNDSGSSLRSNFPEVSPDMVKMASDTISKMSPEELQKMAEVASSLNMNAAPTTSSTRKSEAVSQPSVARSSDMSHHDSGASTSGGLFPNSSIGQSASGFSNSTGDLQENMRNSMKDPAMRQMLASMMKNISPEMMSNMSEQFGVKLSREEAAKAQEAMSTLSPDALERMMRWADRAQRGVETAKKTKNWLLGKSGLIFAILMLILAFIFHKLGFIGG